MIDQNIRELIEGELDNSNSPSESQMLQKMVAADAKVASYYREMKELDKTLRSGIAVEPPATLKSDIMARIAQEKAGIYTETIPIWTLLCKRVTFQSSAIFSVGLAAGLALFFIFSSGNQPTWNNETDLYGTIATPANYHQFKTVGEGDIKAANASVHVITQSDKGVTLADLSVNATDNVTVTVDFDSNALSFRGFNQTQPASNEFSVSGGTIQFVQNGNGRYTFLFDTKGNNAGNVTVRITQNGVSAVNSFPVK